MRRLLESLRLDALVIRGEANLRARCGFGCDNGWLVVMPSRGGVKCSFYTDARYTVAAKRFARGIAIADISRFRLPAKLKRVGYESAISHRDFLALSKFVPRAEFVDVSRDLLSLRAVKDADEIVRMRRASAANMLVWRKIQRRFRPGMTELEMATVIRKLQLDLGGTESFPTIVCVGANAAEAHHEPDDTVWNGRESVLVDMGVTIDGYCSDVTRNLVPRMAGLYRRVYELVKTAHDAAIAAVKPGIRGSELDRIARSVIAKGGFGRCFGHSLGHGVGLEIHEAPVASKKSDWVLEPGMCVTIEPGIYLPDNLGVRIEDLVLVTESGCEVLSQDLK